MNEQEIAMVDAINQEKTEIPKHKPAKSKKKIKAVIETEVKNN